jgi:hypothetical protein
MIADVIFYVTSFSPQIGYASHIFGWITGFLWITSLLVYFKEQPVARTPATQEAAPEVAVRPNRCYRILSFSAKGLLCVLLTSLVYHYLTIFPVTHSKQYLSSGSLLHNQDVLQTDCCAQMFLLLETHAELTQEMIQEHAICSNHKLYSPLLYEKKLLGSEQEDEQQQGVIEYLGPIGELATENSIISTTKTMDSLDQIALMNAIKMRESEKQDFIYLGQ